MSQTNVALICVPQGSIESGTICRRQIMVGLVPLWRVGIVFILTNTVMIIIYVEFCYFFILAVVVGTRA